MSLPSTPFLRNTALALAFACSAPFMPAAHAGSDAYVGELFLFSGTFCPKSTAPAAGQMMAISQNVALFSILGTTYGGDGITTFGLPDLRGRTPIGAGSGPGLTSVNLGERGGTEIQTLTSAQMPMHTHNVTSAGVPASTQGATHATPGPGRVLAQAQNAGIYREGGPADTSLGNSVTIGIAGGSQPVSVRNPYLGMQWCIVLNGIFPTRD
jgi:microcystin-dependent protein